MLEVIGTIVAIVLVSSVMSFLAIRGLLAYLDRWATAPRIDTYRPTYLETSTPPLWSPDRLKQAEREAGLETTEALIARLNRELDKEDR